MKKIIIQSAVALALVGSSLVYAQSDSLTAQPISVISSKPADAMPIRRCEAPGRSLRLGDGVRNKRVEEVKKLQEHLIEQDHMTGTATGYFGPLTLSAVKKLQKYEGVNQTGYVGPLTLEKIKNRCGEPIAVCDYAAPPEGCTYVAGPNYNPRSQCGMVLKCGGNTGYEPEANCKSWNDGCNICSRQTPDGAAACTKRACIGLYMQQAKCNEYFDTGKTCTALGTVYKEGQSTSCIDDGYGNKACIADATHVCRNGAWKIEGGMPPIKPFPIKPTEPIACTMEARLCADGSMMPRGNDCTWLPNLCPWDTR